MIIYVCCQLYIFPSSRHVRINQIFRLIIFIAPIQSLHEPLLLLLVFVLFIDSIVNNPAIVPSFYSNNLNFQMNPWSY